MDLIEFAHKCCKKYASETSTLKNDHEMCRALDLCVVCHQELEEYTSKKGNTYMAVKGTAIIHFVYNTCCYSFADVTKAKKDFEAQMHKEPKRTKNTSDYIEAPIGKIE